MLIKTVIYRHKTTGEKMEKTFQVKGSYLPRKVTVDRNSEGEKESLEFMNQPEVDYLVSYYSKDLLDI
mgnify:CR=1 FL=1